MPDHTATGTGTFPAMTGSVTTGLVAYSTLPVITASAIAYRNNSAAGAGSLLAGMSDFTGAAQTNLIASGEGELPVVLTGEAFSGASAYRKPFPPFTGSGVALTMQSAEAARELRQPTGDAVAVLSRNLTAAETFPSMEGTAAALINHILAGTAVLVPFVQSAVAVGSGSGGEESSASNRSRFDGYVLEHHR